MPNNKIVPVTRINKFFSNEDFELEGKMVIYKITNLLNNKIYIGQDSKNNPNYLGSGAIIKKAIKKYGKENFKKEIIDWSDNKNDLNNKEIFWIKEYNSTNRNIGYNITEGGGGTLGYKPNNETLNKMRNNNIGSKNPMFGKKLSSEILIKRSNKVKSKGTFKGENNSNFKYKIEKDELYNLFIINNLKIEEIAKYYGCHRTVISDNLKKYNIKKETSNKYNIDLLDIKKYLDNGLTQVQIGKIYGCSNKYINKIIKNKIIKNE
jgi:group I intron endonuclease